MIIFLSHNCMWKLMLHIYKICFLDKGCKIQHPLQRETQLSMSYCDQVLFIYFSIWDSFHDYSRFTGQQRKGEAISLTPLFHFHTLQRHLDISRENAAGSSPLHIISNRSQTGNLSFPSKSRYPLSYTPFFY